MQLQAKFNSIENVRQFVELAAKFPCDIDVVTGQYILDGKSILALFSIDRKQLITVKFHGTDDLARDFCRELSEILPIYRLNV